MGCVLETVGRLFCELAFLSGSGKLFDPISGSYDQSLLDVVQIAELLDGGSLTGGLTESVKVVKIGEKAGRNFILCNLVEEVSGVLRGHDDGISFDGGHLCGNGK